MIKRILIIVVLVFMYGCNSSIDINKTRSKIDEKKNEILKLQNEINKLKKSLLKKGQNENTGKILVSVKRIKPEKFEHFHIVNGTVEAVKAAVISPEISGRIKTIYVYEGQRVKKGEVLAELNSSVIKSSILELKGSLDLANTLFKKRESLWKKNIGSEIQYLEAKNRKEALEKKIETLKNQLDMAVIKAPINGIVDNVEKKSGELAMPGLPIMEVVNLKEVYIKSDVSESYLSKIHIGDETRITFPSFPDMEWTGKILRVGNTINPLNRTFKVTVKLNNSEELLKPNLVAVLKLRDFSDENAMVVPSIIIKNDINGSYLYRVVSDGKLNIAEKMYVKTGKMSKDEILITEGINYGDLVIVKGYNLVKNKSLVELYERGDKAGNNEQR